MVWDIKDALALILGFILGIPASMIASLALGPAMTIICGFRIVKILSKIRKKIFSDADFDVPWKQVWYVQSESFPTENPSALKIYRFMHLIAGEADMTTALGSKTGYRIIAVLSANKITGKWMDPRDGGYYGAFQANLSPTREEALGMWVGFSKTGVIKCGKWDWHKLPH